MQKKEQKRAGLRQHKVFNATTGLFECLIPGQKANLVKYRISACDNAGNIYVDSNAGEYYIYSVIPEFTSLILISTLMIAALVVIVSRKRKYV